MAKASRLTRVKRRALSLEASKTLVLITTTLISIVSAFVTMAVLGATLVVGITGAILVVGLVAVIALSIWSGSKQETHLPIDDMSPCTPVSGEKVILCCPCDESITRQANEPAAQFYGDEAIDFNQYELWRLKNKRILVCLIDNCGIVQGYFDILPLRVPAADMLVDGRMVESDVAAKDILSERQMNNCTRLYFAGIAVRDPDSYAGRRYASILTWGIVKYLECFYPPTRERQVMAIAATPQGEALLDRFGFRVTSPAVARRDHHNLYQLTLSDQSVLNISVAVRNWQNACYLGWENKSVRPKKESTQQADTSILA